MNFTQHLHNSAKMTKQEKATYAIMRPRRIAKEKYEKLIKEANEAKELYLLMKGKLKTTSADKLEAITTCIDYEKERAIECWNEAQKLKDKF
tara:strand:+ start:3425 stop:3700 length:276 start_codon:yes stop_codon:yes gene_type:complete